MASSTVSTTTSRRSFNSPWLRTRRQPGRSASLARFFAGLECRIQRHSGQHHVMLNIMTATVPSGRPAFVEVNSLRRPGQQQSLPCRSQFGSISPLKVSRRHGDLHRHRPHQAEKITVGGKAVDTFTVNSDDKVTFKIPAAAKTGKIVLTTPGGSAASTAVFVTQ